jgi:hypothetical protein
MLIHIAAAAITHQLSHLQVSTVYSTVLFPCFQTFGLKSTYTN